MALYSLTFAQLKSEAEHAIGGVPDSRTSLDRIVNGALEHLCIRHAWNWRAAITTLNFTADTPTITLPEDFGELIDLTGYVEKFTAVRPAPLSDIVRAWVHSASGSHILLYHVGQAAQSSAGTVPRRTLKIAPTPASSVTDALYLTYRRLIPTLVADTDVPAIPYGMFDLLRLLARAMAVSSTTQQSGHDWELFNNQLMDYIHADSLAGGANLGRLSNALESDGGAHALQPWNEVKTAYDP